MGATGITLLYSIGSGRFECRLASILVVVPGWWCWVRMIFDSYNITYYCALPAARSARTHDSAYRNLGKFCVIKFQMKKNFAAKDELRKIVALLFWTRHRKKHRSSKTLRLSWTPQSSHHYLLGTLLVRDPSVLATLLAFLAVIDLLHLFHSKSNRLWEHTRDNDPLGSGRLLIILCFRIDIVSSASTRTYVASFLGRL